LESSLNSILSPFRPTSKAIEKQWDAEANNISAGEKGFHRFLSGTGDVLGFVTGIMATGNVTGSTPAVALSIFGDSLDAAKAKYPNSPIKQYTSAGVETALYTAMGKKVFPAKQVKEALSKVRPEVQGLVNALADGKIIVGNASNVATAVSMSSEATIINTGAITLSNSAVIGKVLTGYVSAPGTVAATDSILQAIEKLNGNNLSLKQDYTNSMLLMGG